MTRREILALRSLPTRYIRDGLQFCSHRDLVIVIHSLLPPIKWDGTKWTRVRLEAPTSPTTDPWGHVPKPPPATRARGQSITPWPVDAKKF